MKHAQLLSASAAGLLAAFLSAGAAQAQTAGPNPATAQPPQTVQDVRDEIDRLKKELDALRQNYDQRLSILEQRIGALTAGPNVPDPAPASPVATPLQPATTPLILNLTPANVTPANPASAPGADGAQGGAAGAAQPATNMAGASKAFNPDMSVIANFLGVAGKNPMSTQPPLQLSEAEMAFGAVVDPYARADFFLSAGPEGLSVEEGFVTFTTLPANLLLKVGQLRANFGKVNTMHTHAMPTADRPLVTQNLAGGEDGFDAAGFSVAKLIPNSFMYLEATGELYASDSAVFKSDQRSQLSYLGRVRGYRDLTEGTNIDLGFSYAAGPGNTDFAPAGLVPVGTPALHKQLIGFDATFHYRPLRRAIYKRVNLRSELIWSRQDLPDGPMVKSFGFYGLGEYQFARRWYFGGRVDRSGRTFDSTLTDSGASLFMTYWPSEFSQIRGQYRLTQYGEGVKAHEVLFQFNFAIGAHGAHVF